MPKAYWIAQVTVSNPDQYKLYAESAPLAFKKYGAVILARGGRSARWKVTAGAQCRHRIPFL